MTGSRPDPAPRTVAAAEGATLIGFTLYVALPDSVRMIAAAITVLGVVAVVSLVAAGLRRPGSPRPDAVFAAISALGLVGAVVYLRSLADEPSAIPLAGVGVLFASFVGLVVTACTLTVRPLEDTSA